LNSGHKAPQRTLLPLPFASSQRAVCGRAHQSLKP
jgi:hypothetical protein